MALYLSFIHVNGTFHQGITKLFNLTFTATLYWDSQHCVRLCRLPPALLSSLLKNSETKQENTKILSNHNLEFESPPCIWCSVFVEVCKFLWRPCVTTWQSLSRLKHRTPLRTSRPWFKIRRVFPQISRDWSGTALGMYINDVRRF